MRSTIVVPRKSARRASSDTEKSPRPLSLRENVWRPIPIARAAAACVKPFSAMRSRITVKSFFMDYTSLLDSFVSHFCDKTMMSHFWDMCKS
nr:MAG TPA: hypothetical protein [Caudoviricetes sp.]